ncbi:hypothetical protein INT43_006240 [Umbelopsis isabellina]|uniref:Uncharacterized protein n=1 Tax=Mortierella isabellina TaxID=91625 RepID=A0A8H7PZX4_MORIS|nr:hypothetical protein INT43_006240 [Umbelopsis isabellina]
MMVVKSIVFIVVRLCWDIWKMATYTMNTCLILFNPDWTLANNFKLVSGSHNITLPSDLSTKHSYIIVLFGDSGNASPEFTIVKS